MFGGCSLTRRCSVFFFYLFFLITIHLSITLGWLDGCLVHGEKNTDKSIEKLPEHLLAKSHPSNLVNTIFRATTEYMATLHH